MLLQASQYYGEMGVTQHRRATAPPLRSPTEPTPEEIFFDDRTHTGTHKRQIRRSTFKNSYVRRLPTKSAEKLLQETHLDVTIAAPPAKDDGREGSPEGTQGPRG